MGQCGVWSAAFEVETRSLTMCLWAELTPPEFGAFTKPLQVSEIHKYLLRFQIVFTKPLMLILHLKIVGNIKKLFQMTKLTSDIRLHIHPWGLIVELILLFEEIFLIKLSILKECPC